MNGKTKLIWIFLSAAYFRFVNAKIVKNFHFIAFLCVFFNS